jgi:acylglycerol lipase
MPCLMYVQVCKDYETDPLNFPGKTRTRTAQQIQIGFRNLQNFYTDIKLPVYGHHGDTDRCVSLKAHETFMSKISSTDKTLEVVKGGYHELLLGPQKDRCFDSISKWILDHAAALQGQSSL